MFVRYYVQIVTILVLFLMQKFCGFRHSLDGAQINISHDFLSLYSEPIFVHGFISFPLIVM